MPKTHNDSPLKMSRNPMDVKSEKKKNSSTCFDSLESTGRKRCKKTCLAAIWAGRMKGSKPGFVGPKCFERSV